MGKVYIDKAALVAEIKKRINFNERLNAYPRLDECNEILSFIDTLKVEEIGVDLGDLKGDKSAKCIIDTKTLEVKEVDLEEEIDKELDEEWYGEYIEHDKFRKSAKHFFELGMQVSNKAKKGE